MTLPAKARFPVTDYYTPEGDLVHIRPIVPDDVERERAFLAGLSSASLYQRQLSSRNKLLPGELERLTHIDYDREMALVATVEQNGGPLQIGVARYVRDESGDTAECAIVITDAWQGKGLGERLLRELIATARVNGVKRLTGITLTANYKLMKLARKLGFRAESWQAGANVTAIGKNL
jgi:acetyltransferase